MPYEDLKPTFSAITGRFVAVDTPVPVLARMGFFDGGSAEVRLLFFSRPGALSGARRALSRPQTSPVLLMHGAITGLPLRRSSVGVVVCPLPGPRDPDLLRSLRRTAGVLVRGGTLVMHGVVRRSLVGWSAHVASMLVRKDGGLPSEWDITSWMLRSGYNRIVRVTGGRFVPSILVSATRQAP